MLLGVVCELYVCLCRKVCINVCVCACVCVHVCCACGGVCVLASARLSKLRVCVCAEGVAWRPSRSPWHASHVSPQEVSREYTDVQDE